MKKKLSILLILVVAVFVLATVGYAAWYITRDSQNVEVSNVEAYAINSEVVTVTLSNQAGTAEDTSQSIVFGRPSSEYDTGWLRFTGETNPEEHLFVYVKVSSNMIGDYEISGTLEKASATVTTALFTGPTFTVEGTPSNASLDANGHTIHITAADGYIVLKVTYAWALGSNPHTYFNAHTDKTVHLTSEQFTAANAILDTDLVSSTGDTWKDYANNYLDDLDDFCDGLSFVITVE